MFFQNKEVKEQISTNAKAKKHEPIKIINQNKTKMLEKTKSQERKIKESIDYDSQKTNNENSSVNKNDELANMENDTIKNSEVEFTIKPVDEEIKNIVDDSLKIE